jgi:hypothetical protein
MSYAAQEPFHLGAELGHSPARARQQADRASPEDQPFNDANVRFRGMKGM